VPIIATMTIDHHADAVALWRSSPGVGVNECDERPMVEAYLLRNPGMSWVAHADGRLVGAVLCGTDGRRGYLHHLAVAAGHQGRGLGRELVARCLASLAAFGIVRCHIFVFADNSAGQAFWTHAGWVRRDDLLVMSSATTAPVR
jgi:N-acetylglutamate synthase